MKARIVMVDQQHFSMARDPKPNVIRIRVDHTPEEGEPMYDEQHILVPIRPLTEEEINDPALADLVPKEWRTNPALCQFIEVPADIEDSELEQIVRKQLKIAKSRAATIQQVEKELTPKIKEFEAKWLGLEVKE